MLGVDKGHPKNKDVSISFPALVVNGSHRVRVSVTGKWLVKDEADIESKILDMCFDIF